MLTTAEVAKVFDVEPVTVRAWLAKKLFTTAEKIGRDWFIARREVDRFKPPTMGRPKLKKGERRKKE